MNRNYDWKTLLTYANEDLAAYGYSLKVYEKEEGFYFLDIVKDGVDENYAGNYYEDELSDLINDAWHHIKTNLV